jgi:hypothetical protein
MRCTATVVPLQSQATTTTTGTARHRTSERASQPPRTRIDWYDRQSRLTASPHCLSLSPRSLSKRLILVDGPAGCGAAACQLAGYFRSTEPWSRAPCSRAPCGAAPRGGQRDGRPASSRRRYAGRQEHRAGRRDPAVGRCGACGARCASRSARPRIASSVLSLADRADGGGWRRARPARASRRAARRWGEARWRSRRPCRRCGLVTGAVSCSEPRVTVERRAAVREV